MAVTRQWCRFSLVDEEGCVVAGGVVGGEANPDIDVVDVIARLALMARRTGTSVVLADASPELVELIELSGLPVEVQG